MLCTRSSTKTMPYYYYCDEESCVLRSTVKPRPLSDGILLSMEDKDQWQSEERRLGHQGAAKVSGDLFRNSTRSSFGIAVLDRS